MPEKKTNAGKQYRIDGKRFIWTAEVDDGEEPFEVVLPLRMKLGTVRKLGGLKGAVDAETMFAIVEALAPNQSEAVDEMDIMDFMAAFEAWQREYELLSGANLGE